MGSLYKPRIYFVQYPPHPLLRVWALQTIIQYGLLRRIKRIGKTSRDAVDHATLNHNVRSAESEFVRWLAVNGFTEKYLRNEQLFERMMDKFCNHAFLRIDDIIRIFTEFAKTLPIREQSFDDEAVLEKREIEELRPIVLGTYRREAIDVLGNPKTWSHRQLDEYFDWFPQDEFRVPSQWAITSLRTEGGNFWGLEEIKVFGYPNGVMGQRAVEPSQFDVLSGESWREALEKDPDDIEPWQK